MTQDTTEFEFMGILLRHQVMINSCQCIWNFKRPFNDQRLNVMWSCLKELFLNTGKVSAVGIRRQMKKANPNINLDIVSEVSKYGSHTLNFSDLLAEIQSRMIIRELYFTAQRITSSKEDPEAEGLRLLELTSRHVRAIEQGMTFETDVSIPEAVKALIEKAERVVNEPNTSRDYIKTGFPGLDRKIMGLERGRMYVIGARPSIGKTAFALSMLGNIERNKTHCGFISCEMAVESLLTRRVQQICNIPFNNLIQKRNQEELKKFTETARQYRSQTLSDFVCVSGKMNRRLSNVKLKLRNMVDKNSEIGVIFIDYLQKIVTDRRGHDKASEVGDISGELTDMARENNIALVLLAQLNRGTDEAKPPKMRDLKGSGDIEQDADGILLIDRSKTIKGGGEIQDCFLSVAKSRDGEIGPVPMKFKKSTTLFYDDSLQIEGGF